ncbi:MAG: diacylglycerol/lipid kinase family protein [Actinomycetes bacterium]
MRSFHLLVNPWSGGGSAAGAVVPVARLLREAGAVVAVTYSPGHAATAGLVGESVARGDVVVAVGGDGMVASLAGSVVAAGGTLGIVPSGRGNDFARQLGLSSRPEDVAETLLNAAPRAVDVIDAAGQVVIGSVYVGVDSLASEIANNARHVPKGLLYQYAAVRALASYHPGTYRIEVDGTASEHRAATVVVANSGYYGNGMRIAPSASLTDGLLDVVVIGAASRLQLIWWLPKLYDGSHVTLDEVQVLTGKTVTMSGVDHAVAYGDGERLADLPVTATVRPGALSVLATA